MKPAKAKPDHIRQEDWEAIDSPGLSEDMLNKLRPVSKTHLDILRAYSDGSLRRRGPQKAPTKILLSMRYSQDVLDFFRATGPGWQTKMDEALKQWIREHPEAAR